MMFKINSCPIMITKPVISTPYWIFANVTELHCVAFVIRLSRTDSSIELLDDMCKQPQVGQFQDRERKNWSNVGRFV